MEKEKRIKDLNINPITRKSYFRRSIAMERTYYFYEFITPISPEIAELAQELEKSIFGSPRSMLTHTRILTENIMHLAAKAEDVKIDGRIGIHELINILDEKGIFTTEIRNELHNLRMIGNQASHDPRQFRISEALLAWESLYKVVKWYVEVYGPVDMVVPNYVDPSPAISPSIDTTELEARLKKLEQLLERTLQGNSGRPEREVKTSDELLDRPGFTPIRTITYKDEKLEIPYFLRDTFLLPQRFEKSERFLIRLGGKQEARLMSELPNDLEGLHLVINRYSEVNTEEFFQELRSYVDEEKQREKLKIDRPGELFFFYRADYIVVTEQLGQVPITVEEFKGFPSFIKQLNEQGYHEAGQLPKELVTLAKYKNVGKGTLERFFQQLKMK